MRRLGEKVASGRLQELLSELTIKITERKKKSSLSKVGCLSHDTQEQKYMKLQQKGFLMNTIKVTRRNGNIISLDVSPGNTKTTNLSAGYRLNEIF